MTKDINTIPTVPRHIVSYKIYAEWNDNPKMVQLDHEMDSDIENSFNEWLQQIEDEENAKWEVTLYSEMILLRKEQLSEILI